MLKHGNKIDAIIYLMNFNFIKDITYSLSEDKDVIYYQFTTFDGMKMVGEVKMTKENGDISSYKKIILKNANDLVMYQLIDLNYAKTI